MARKGEKNGCAILTDAQASHIKFIFFVQYKGDKSKIGECIAYIQEFYKLKYDTIYSVIFRRYKHLDSQVNNMIYRKSCGR